MLRFYSLLFLMILSTSVLYAQYTGNREKFAKEFDKSMSGYIYGEYEDFSKKILPELIESDKLSDDQFEVIYKTVNKMIQKRLPSFPAVYNYVYAYSAFILRSQPTESLNNWQKGVDNLLSGKNLSRFKDFLAFSELFLVEDIIADNANFNWYYLGGDFKFLYDKSISIEFQNGRLACKVLNKSKGKKENPFVDSIMVLNAKGTYDPIRQRWHGEGGVLTWEKVGLNKTKTYGELKSYHLSAKVANFSADSVMLTTPYFSYKIEGRVSERAFKANREEDKIYPQFVSYEKRLPIKQIKPGVDYDGGFSLQGANFVGIGFENDPAKMIIYRDGQRFITTKSQQYIVSDRNIISHNTSISLLMNFDEDSITHPGLTFNYLLDKKAIEMTRTKTGNGQAPFLNSYHQLGMYMPKMVWKTDSKELLMSYEVGTSQEQRIATFESINYFDAQLFDRLQGMDRLHPLVAIYNYCYENAVYTMPEGKLASALHKTVEQIKPLFLELSNYGFINYDTEAKMITVNQKLDNFVLAKSGKKDFDNIIFTTDFRPKKLKGYEPEQIEKDKNLRYLQKEYRRLNEERRKMAEFGALDLSSMELNLKAIDFINISDAQRTVIFPRNKEVILKKALNFDFVGWINCGKMEIDALASTFNYQEFKFSILKTHKSLYRVAPLSPRDGDKPIAMLSSLNGIKGELFIDHPTNRSGSNPDFHDYPKIKVSQPSYVYYNSKAIFRGVYDSTRFYYKVDPFYMDSLDNFDEKAFRIIGELTSAGVFPKFRENLTIMPDYSLGFSKLAPKGGYDFYGTGTKYENKIVLSNNGLQGAGIINFVHSTSDSKGYTFFPDSTVGMANFINKPIENGVQFPDVDCDQAWVTYVPRKNMLKAASTPLHDINFFNSEAKLRGTAIVKRGGMRGFGIMSFKNATMISDDYEFTRWNMDSDTTSFALKNQYLEEGEEPIALKTDNVQGHVSFETRMGEFKSNDGEARLDFPINQYFCTMDKFTWFMDLETIEVEAKGGEDEVANADLDLLGPNFFSSHPKQDSLRFRAPKAAFNLHEKSIYCSQVFYLDIADARIYPDSSRVIIRKKAKMEPFKDAKVVANYITQYHTFLHCEIAITARRMYAGKGIYPYYDLDSNKTDFVMDKIVLDSTGQTYATGRIAEDANFHLSKRFDYYGDIKVIAYLPTIIFNGSTRMNHNCVNFPRSWVKLDANIDPANIQIPIEEGMQDIKGKSLVAGIAWRDTRNLDSLSLYPVFLSELTSKKDPIVMNATGLLQFNEDSKEFQIGSMDKLMSRGEPGNYLALHIETCSLNGDGKIDLGMNYGDLKIESVGVVNYDSKKKETTMNLTSKYTFPVDEGLMEDVAERIAAVEDLKPLDFNVTTVEQAALEWAGREEADKMKAAFTINGEKNIPKEMEETMTITGIKLSSFNVRGMKEKGLISSEPTAYIVNMYDKPVYKKVPFKVFYQKAYSDFQMDKFGLQINVPTLDYYLDYSTDKKGGTMRILSGDLEFVEKLNNIKEEKKKIKNFKYQHETAGIYLSKFLRYFEL